MIFALYISRSIPKMIGTMKKAPKKGPFLIVGA